MQAEDDLSLKFEIFAHKQKFAQKDESAPSMPAVLRENGLNGAPAGVLAYRDLRPTPRPQEPEKDNYQRFEIKLKLPTKLDLKQVKVVWSKEKETAEQEQQRMAEAARRKEEKRLRLTKLVKFS